MDGKRMVEVRERERESIWDSGGVRGITARLSHFAVSPASLHQIESIFLVDFRSRSRPRYHGHEIFRGKSAIVQPWLFFFPPILFLSFYFDENIFTVFLITISISPYFERETFLVKVHNLFYHLFFFFLFFFSSLFAITLKLLFF